MLIAHIFFLSKIFCPDVMFAKLGDIEICADQLRQLGNKTSLKFRLEKCVSVPAS